MKIGSDKTGDDSVSHNLTIERFSALCIPQVKAFDCGDEPWAVEVANWLKAPATESESALYAISQYRAAVWLYYFGDELVGFGSLHTTTWDSFHLDGSSEAVSIIPCLGMHRTFHGGPVGAPRENKYCRQILRHLIYEATLLANQYIVLEAHKDNYKAIHLYMEFGFSALPNPDGNYIRMAKRILPPVSTQAPL